MFDPGDDKKSDGYAIALFLMYCTTSRCSCAKLASKRVARISARQGLEGGFCVVAVLQ
jgi:hypothetical protein